MAWCASRWGEDTRALDFVLASGSGSDKPGELRDRQLLKVTALTSRACVCWPWLTHAIRARGPMSLFLALGEIRES